ncbi:MAG: peptidase M19 [Alphaproteobacteria bacterium]|nr:peptidase M19 [Alphaproteobacteria bacterium]
MQSTFQLSDLTASDKAVRFTQENFVLDCLSLAYVLEETYTERCLAGGVNAANVTFVTDADWETALESLEKSLETIEKSPLPHLALTTDDLISAQKDGKLGVLLGTQGAAFIGDALWRVSFVSRLGLRSIGLAYTAGNLLGDGCGETRAGGLTFLGREFVAAVNELPLLLDVSHAGHNERAEVAALATAPVCTHSNAYAVHANDRNTTDETAHAIVDKGGMLGLCGLPKSVADNDPILSDLITHCDHYKNSIGVGNIGLGLDFTEAYQESGAVLDASRVWRTRRPDIFGTVDEFLTQTYPTGLHSIRLLANLTEMLFSRGYTETETAGILGSNWLRTFKRTIG